MQIYNHDVFNPWPLEDKSVQAIITSPPYFGLRKYDIPDVIIGGSPSCDHEWGDLINKKDNRGISGSNLAGRDPYKEGDARLDHGHTFCSLCGAWNGQYGLEPSIELFVEHTLLWCAEAIRVLKDDGIFFLNLGDSYGGSWGNYGSREGKQRERSSEFVDRKGATPSDLKPPMTSAPKKCKLLIPHRIAIALCDRGRWTLRNDIVWYKKNSMPESMQDRFSRRFENIFMFSKSPKYYFDLDAVREPFVYPNKIYKVETEHYKNNNLDRNKMGSYGREKYGDAEKGKNPGDIWEFTTQPSPFAHYAMWPEKLVERMLKCSSRPGDNVLDPFAGSGTTIRVAEQLNRHGIGFDLGYAEIQEQRLSGIQKELYAE